MKKEKTKKNLDLLRNIVNGDELKKLKVQKSYIPELYVSEDIKPEEVMNLSLWCYENGNIMNKDKNSFLKILKKKSVKINDIIPEDCEIIED